MGNKRGKKKKDSRPKPFVDRNKEYYILTEGKYELRLGPNKCTDKNYVISDLHELSSIMNEGDWVNVVKIDRDVRCNPHNAHVVSTSKIIVIDRLPIYKFIVELCLTNNDSVLTSRILYKYLKRINNTPTLKGKRIVKKVINMLGDVERRELMISAVQNDNMLIYHYLRKKHVGVITADIRLGILRSAYVRPVINDVLKRKLPIDYIDANRIALDLLKGSLWNDTTLQSKLSQLFAYNGNQKFKYSEDDSDNIFRLGQSITDTYKILQQYFDITKSMKIAIIIYHASTFRAHRIVSMLSGKSSDIQNFVEDLRSTCITEQVRIPYRLSDIKSIVTIRTDYLLLKHNVNIL